MYWVIFYIAYWVVLQYVQISKIDSGKHVKPANAWLPWLLPVMGDASAHCLQQLPTTVGRANMSVSVLQYAQAIEPQTANFNQARDLYIHAYKAGLGVILSLKVATAAFIKPHKYGKLLECKTVQRNWRASVHLARREPHRFSGLKPRKARGPIHRSPGRCQPKY